MKRLSVIAGSEALRTDLGERLHEIARQAGYTYEDHPTAQCATNSRIVMVDGTPSANARLQDEYNKILRIKKSMGKRDDMYCVIGRRRDYRRYPRGTYPNLSFFCIGEKQLDEPEADLPPEGLDTIEGPRLYNYCDVAAVIAAYMR